MSSEYTLDDYQDDALRFSRYGSDDSALKDIVLGMNEEAGEAAGKVKKVSRDKGGVWDEESEEAFFKELGDNLWYIAAAARNRGKDLSYIASLNIDKLTDRNERGAIHGSGDNR